MSTRSSVREGAEHAAVGDGQASPSSSRLSFQTVAPWSVVAGYIVMVVVFTVLRPDTFLTTGTLGNLLDQAVVPVILACGLTVVVAVGEFDLSFTAVLGVSAGLVITFMAVEGMAVPIAMLLVVLIALGIGVIIGALVTLGRASSFIVTLAISSVVIGFELAITDNKTIFLGVPQAYVALGQGSTLTVHRPVLLMVIIVLAVSYLMHATTYGRHVYAVGGNRTAAFLAGVPVRRVRIAAFVLVAVLAAFGAFVRTSVSGSYFPNASDGYLLNTYAAVFLGAAAVRSGKFTVPGSVFGVIWLLTLQTGLTQLNQPAWASTLLQGVVLSVAVLLAARVRREARAA